ncbi:SacI homology domain-containing protein [Mucor mucedo]|uniref:SacI homology domain-containing protein n=1 Tax=Mucor mucedo TaxID=29922 RepID=UPI00221F2F08|nr:SacI homology domain-containing protein [Mucor mucedo]KAI7874281.1 SacI homology domain-containing protein [Mucor mucedo]
MQTHLLLRESPRALALRPTVLEEAPSGVLVFEEYAGSNNRAMAKLFAPSEFEDSKWRILNSRPVFGCLGLITIQSECFVAIVTDCVSVGRIRAGEEVYKIQSVSFYSLSSARYDDLVDFPGKDFENDDNWGDQTGTVIQHPCAQLQKLFSIGNFYFTPDFDLTKTVQARTSVASLGVHSFDQHFLWNQFLISGLLDFRSKLERKKQMDLDRGGFLVFSIRGYVGVEVVDIDNEKYELSVISKLSCQRAGTRFNTRGIDDNGHVANFVETETILYSDRICYSYTQIRGSVPVFWEQQGMQLVQHKIQISRGQAATQPAVKRHFDELVDRYNCVCNINLLSQKEATAGESVLSNAFNTAVNQLDYNKDTVRMVNFDLHAECRGGNYDNVAVLMKNIRRVMDDYGFFLMDSDDNQIICKQKGVFRTNCMDCLDRTNLVQNEISRRALLDYLQDRFRDSRSNINLEHFVARHSHLWAENGDGLSKIYAGTGALKSAFTRTGKVTFMNVLSDATRSVNRFYINNFQDKARQEVIDQLLGKLENQAAITIYDPISDTVTRQLSTRMKEYSTNRKITIFSGTYNLNGKGFKGELLDPWLLQHFKLGNKEEPDIYVVGFQEIVELSPQQVMATDADKRKIWEQQIESTLNSRPEGKFKYTLLRSNQLVGAALIIFAKSNIVEEIRNVETAIKKTGIMGIAGNKGAVAIRMDYGDTSFCFVAAHLASGHSNVDDRNADFHTIDEGLRFLRGKTIGGHDNVIWVSDLNYRVSLPNEEARLYAKDGNIDALLKNDQLTREMRQHRVFEGYKEGIITFLPTYKYDNGTDVYDSSEKQRIPGWTDRILFKGKHLKQLQYSRAELYTSDHRPVLALFEANVITLDKEAKVKLQKELYQSLSSIEVRALPPPDLPKRKLTAPISTKSAMTVSEPIATSSSSMKLSDSYADTLVDISIDSSGFPSPSTDSNKWWEDGTELPKADKSRSTGMNPFLEEEDFIMAGGSSLKFPSSIQSDSEWTPLSPISVYSPSVTNGAKKPSVITNSNNNNVSSVIGFWNNKQ